MSDRETLILAFLAQHGWDSANRHRMANDASFRHYERLAMGRHKAVLMDAPPPKEDVRPFIKVDEHLTG